MKRTHRGAGLTVCRPAEPRRLGDSGPVVVAFLPGQRATLEPFWRI